jgi:opacity protein-like surface antigen
MRWFVACVICLLFVASMAQAATVATTAGTKAMVFRFSGLSNLGLSGYSGMQFAGNLDVPANVGVGMRYYIHDGLAIRPGLDIGMARSSEKGLGGDTDDKTSGSVIGLSVAIEKHLPGPANVSPYMGGGAGFGMARATSEPSRPQQPATGTMLKATDKAVAFGVFGMLGFEWGFTESLTLGGEYRLGLNVSSGSTEREFQNSPTVKSNEISGLGIGFGTASVYLSAGW